MHLFPRISAIALTVALATPALAQDAEQSPATGQASDSGEASLPDNAIVEGAWDTVFSNQIFISDDGDSGYGYKVLRAGTRADSQPPRMGVSAEL